ncbi:MAG: hypothetical protein ACKVQA_03165 [Burkholderiales bacterium]
MSTITVTTVQGYIFAKTYAIQVIDPLARDAQLRAVFTGMLDRLRANDIEGALSALTGRTAEKYRVVFNALRQAGLLTSAADGLGTINSGTLVTDLAEYQITRNTPNGPRSFYLYLLRGEDGIWRIDGM